MIQQRDFGKAKLFTLINSRKISVSIMNYGGIVQSILLPDLNNDFVDVALGFDEFSPYLKPHPYFGAIVGRYGNRIGKGKFVLEGREYQLAQNNGENHLHGGVLGFDKKFWAANIERNALVLQYTSEDMEEGYPGQLDVEVRYKLDNENRLSIQYSAQSSKTTILNLTNHTYFNLAGRGQILDHQAKINASSITEVDAGMIPTGNLMSVLASPLDFTSMKRIGDDIKSSHPQVAMANGFDHNYVLDEAGVNYLAARVVEPVSKRFLEVYTDEPGVQFYTGNSLNGTYDGREGSNYGPHSGFCLETQHFPDSPNHENFPSTVLRPGEIYRSETIYKFGVEN